MSRARGALVLVCAGTVATAVLIGGAAFPAGDGVTVVLSGLRNPRHVHMASDGSIYIAEAGRGGNHCSGPTRAKTCIGFSSSITRYSNGAHSRVVTGLVSAASKDGSFAVGADDVAVGQDGTIFSIETSAGRHPGLPRAYTRQLGRLLATSTTGRRGSVARIDRYEFRHNPDRAKVDSNPYAVAVDPAGGWVVADAGANDLLHVTTGGRVSVVSTFRARRDPGSHKKSDSVPTSIVVGPDGAFYVGELRGSGAPRDSARVWRVTRSGTKSVYASGFNRVVGLDFGPDGSLFVAELVTTANVSPPYTGAVIHVAPDGSRSQLAPGELTAPGGVAVAPDGTVYVTVSSLSARRGKLVRIEGTGPSPSPSDTNPSESPSGSPSPSSVLPTP